MMTTIHKTLLIFLLCCFSSSSSPHLLFLPSLFWQSLFFQVALHKLQWQLPMFCLLFWVSSGLFFCLSCWCCPSCRNSSALANYMGYLNKWTRAPLHCKQVEVCLGFGFGALMLVYEPCNWVLYAGVKLSQVSWAEELIFYGLCPVLLFLFVGMLDLGPTNSGDDFSLVFQVSLRATGLTDFCSLWNQGLLQAFRVQRGVWDSSLQQSFGNCKNSGNCKTASSVMGCFCFSFPEFETMRIWSMMYLNVNSALGQQ